MKVYANITNGLAFPHDDVCSFLSTHGHNCKFGYFRIDAMPYSAVIELLKGNPIKVVDATQHNKSLSDGLKFGLTTWTLVFNRALRKYVPVSSWQTREMLRAAHSNKHRRLVKRIRRLEKIYGNVGPVRIGDGELIEVRCYRNFRFDDKPTELPLYYANYG